jgi:ribosomal protein S12 methylthiotransferase
LYCIFLFRQVHFQGINKNKHINFTQIETLDNNLFPANLSPMVKRRKKPITVGFVSLGCPKNLVDTETMLAHIAQAGFLITADPEQAEVVIINTCGFIEPAKTESLGAIRDAISWKGKGTVRKVIVAGCLPQRFGRQPAEQLEGADAIMGLAYRDHIADIIHQTYTSDAPVIYLEKPLDAVFDDRARLLTGLGHSPYLRISDGCSHRCSFCTIPSIRGPFHSKPPELVVAEAEELVSAGAVELNIIAQDTSSYGRDLKIKDGLSTLITQLEKIPGLTWTRLMYLWPAGINENLLDTIAASRKVAHYLDIPIQHVNNRILNAMRRPDTHESLHRLIEDIRSAIPDIILRTTMIVGFPGESDSEFSELLDFVNWAKFDALGCFTFFPESGTTAAELPDQIPEQIQTERLERLMLNQQQTAFAKNNARIGTTIVCLVDTIGSEGSTTGRFYGQARDIDSVCIIKNCSAQPGDFVTTKVTGTKDYDLVVCQG